MIVRALQTWLAVRAGALVVWSLVGHHARGMRKVWLILRVLIAAAGVGYIVWSVSWRDRIVVPAGTSVRPGWTLEKPQAFPASHTLQGEWQLEIPPASESASISILRVDPSQVGVGPGDYQFRPGAWTTVRGARVGWLAVGLLIVAPVFVLQALRWWALMRARRLGVAWWSAFRLYMAGAFFNYCMPGMTGGDVLKAYYAARDSDRRADAVISVVVDRIAGMLGLVLLAGIAGLFMLANPLARQVTLCVWLATATLVAAAIIYNSAAIRRRFSQWTWLSHLPGASLWQRIDAAVLAYRGHPVAVTLAILLSVAVHLCLALASASAAYALGANIPLGLLLAVMPVVFAAGALPISFQGLGIMEGVAMALLLREGSFSANQIVGMLLLVRVFPLLYALLGSVFVIRGQLRMLPAPSEPAMA